MQFILCYMPLNTKNMDEVIITEHDEVFFKWEVEKYKLKIKRKATSDETIEYVNEYNNLMEEGKQNESEMYYHELPN